MRFGVLGINYKSAPLGLRELLSRVFHRLYGPHTIHSYKERTVLLSTCNRCELYFYHEDLAYQQTRFLKQLKAEIAEEFEHALYSYFDGECFEHLSKVTAGLDSAFIGENEIQRQVKEAYLSAKKQMALPRSMHFLFQKSLQNGKLREELGLHKYTPSLSHIVIGQVMDLAPKSILIIGHSKIGMQCLRALKWRTRAPVVICTRYPAGLNELILPWDALFQWNEFDCVIATSKVEVPVLTGPRGRSRIIFDLSMPGCADKSMDIPIVDIDKLAPVIAGRQQLVSYGEKKIRQIVERQLMLFEKRQQALA